MLRFRGCKDAMYNRHVGDRDMLVTVTLYSDVRVVTYTASYEFVADLLQINNDCIGCRHSRLRRA